MWRSMAYLAKQRMPLPQHFTLRPVGVEHSHLQVGYLRLQDENDSVAADTKMAVAHFP